MLENRNNNRKTGQKGQVKRGFKQEQHSNVNLLDQNSNLAEDYYFKLSKFAGNKTVQRMVEDGSIFNHQQTESTVDMKGLTQRKVKEVNNYVPPKKVAPKNYVKKSSSSTSTNKTGLPDQLKSGIESLANMDLSDIRVHYNSKKPKDINAHAFTQGTDIHVAPGQEKHLAHEAWHVVQQKQGRVKPTTQVSGVNVNDNKHLEREADLMGSKALKSGGKAEGKKPVAGKSKPVAKSGKGAVQRKTVNLTTVPDKVLDKEVLTVTPAKKAKGLVNRYNHLRMDNPDYATQIGILEDIIKFLEAVKMKKVAQRVKDTVQRMAEKRAVVQLAKKAKKDKKKSGSSSSGKSKAQNTKGSGSKDKSGKKDVNNDKKEKESKAKQQDNSKIVEEFNAVKGIITGEAQVEKKAVEEQLKKFNDEALDVAFAQKEEDEAKAASEQKGEAPAKTGNSKAEEKAKAKDRTEDKPEAEALKKNKDEKKVEDREKANEQAREVEEVKKQQKEEEKANAESGGGESKAATKEQAKKDDKVKKDKEKQLVTEKQARDKDKKKETERKEEQKASTKEKANKENEKLSGKKESKGSANGKEQQVAKDSQEKRDKKNAEKQKKEADEVKDKKDAEAEKEKQKKLEEELKEQPPFEQIKKLTPENIIPKYKYSWKKALEHLTTIKYAKDKNEYAQRNEVMRDLISFRSKEINALLDTVLDKAAGELLAKRGDEMGLGKSFKILPKSGNKGFEVMAGDYELIEASAPGSQEMTSDIDVTFKAPGNADYEGKLVSLFNNGFRSKWKMSSGPIFDVNAYTSGFMSKEAGHSAKADKHEELLKGSQEVDYKSVLELKGKTQLAIGLLPIREHFGKDREAWDDFTAKIIKDLILYTKNNELPTEAEGFIRAELKALFKQTNGLYKKTSSEIKKGMEREGAENKELSPEHIEALAKDKLYEKQLEKTDRLLEARKRFVSKINELLKVDAEGGMDSSQAKELESLQKKLASNLKVFDVEQGKALVYANEAYYNAGSVIHVVEGMQKGGKGDIGQQQLTESLLMNIGYKLKHFKHTLEEEGQGNAIVKTSKYGQRVHDALKKSNELDTLLPEDKKMLRSELNIIKNYKKNKTYLTPAAKEAKALDKFGKKMTEETVNESFLRIAQDKLISTYILRINEYVRKLNENSDKEDK